MIVRDLHGLTLDKSLGLVDEVIGRVRSNGIADTAEFITGHGPIRAAVFAALESYSLIPHYKWGNDGVVVCVIE